MGVQSITSIGAGLGLSYLGSALQGDPELSTYNFTSDEKPTTRASRGVALPLLIGRQRVAPIIAWAGDRKKETESVGGGADGKGGGAGGGAEGPVITKYYEAAWHLLAIGPSERLHAIFAGGKRIWKGPISRESHPSGADIELDDDQEFEIYWGEPDQPTSQYLADQEKIPLSRWPYITYVIWRRKYLGTSGYRWQDIEYELETRPYFTGLSRSSPWIEQVFSQDEDKEFNIIAAANGTEGAAWVRCSGKHKKAFKAGLKCYLDGAGPPTGFYDIASRTYDKTANTTTVFLEDDFTSLNTSPATGTISAVDADKVDGANPAHLIYQAQFAPFPHGIGMSTEGFDLNSLETVGEALSAIGERLPSTLYAENYATFRQAFSSLMADWGVVCRFKDGLYRWKLIREETPPLPLLPSQAILAPKPERRTFHDTPETDRALYLFYNSKRKYRLTGIPIDDDGIASQNDVSRPKRIELQAPRDHETADRIAERRSQEELGDHPTVRLIANHEARRIAPGDLFEADGIPFPLRCLEFQPETLSGRVVLDCKKDAYGVAESTFLQEEDENPDDEDLEEVTGDHAFTFIEVPEAECPTAKAKVKIIIPRIRATSQSLKAVIWLSKNGTKWKKAGATKFVCAGGLLLDQLPAWDTIGGLGDPILDEGPTFSPLGPDQDSVVDLTDDDAWLAGEQVCVIGDEVMFLKKVTVVSEGVHRLDGLARAQYDTLAEFHQIGDPVYIFPFNAAAFLTHKFLKPGNTIHLKIVPQLEDSEGVPLDEIDAEVKTLIGKCVAPMTPGEPYTDLHPDLHHRNVYLEGEDVTVQWAWRDGTVGVGSDTMTADSDKVADADAPSFQGKFIVAILDPADMDANGFSDPVREEVVTDSTWTYTSGAREADFGGADPSAFSLRIRHRRNGVESGPSHEVTFRKWPS